MTRMLRFYICALLGFYAPQIGSLFPTFWDNLSATSSMVERSKKKFFFVRLGRHSKHRPLHLIAWQPEWRQGSRADEVRCLQWSCAVSTGTIYRPFGGYKCLHLQRQAVREDLNFHLGIFSQIKAPIYNTVSSLRSPIINYVCLIFKDAVVLLVEAMR
jgi:hypothetical protein